MNRDAARNGLPFFLCRVSRASPQRMCLRRALTSSHDRRGVRAIASLKETLAAQLPAKRKYIKDLQPNRGSTPTGFHSLVFFPSKR